jgi:hypothetical protein
VGTGVGVTVAVADGVGEGVMVEGRTVARAVGDNVGGRGVAVSVGALGVGALCVSNMATWVLMKLVASNGGVVTLGVAVGEQALTRILNIEYTIHNNN